MKIRLLSDFKSNAVGLTEQEQNLLNLTVDCWNSWCSLPKRSDTDNEEFMRTIHAAQRLIALRVARRVDPYIWRTGE